MPSITKQQKSRYLNEISNYRWTQKLNRRSNMHPATAGITMSAHIRDLQRMMHPERNERLRLRQRLARIRKSR